MIESVQLDTQDQEKVLILSDFERFRCKVEVFSRGFSYKGGIYFDNLSEFSQSISEMYKCLEGSSELREDYHEHFLKLSMTKLGHVVVSGLFVEYSEHEQRLSFEFETDQTCLQKFGKELDHVLLQLS